MDNCCFNRPFDDQTQIRIKLETEAKLYIQEKIRQHELELAWSYILDYENFANPYEDRRQAIQEWKDLAVIDVDDTSGIVEQAEALKQRSIHSKDALHVACAVWSECEVFLTTDDRILKKLHDFNAVKVLSPLTFMALLENNDEN